MSGIVYAVVCLFTFFVGSFMVYRHGHEDPTDPPNLLLLAGASLVWPITVPLAAGIMLLIVIAKLAIRLAGGAK